ncbi:MAG: hypothetical protein ABEI86_12635 [Halobacteriaceae archaeon]
MSNTSTWIDAESISVEVSSFNLQTNRVDREDALIVHYGNAKAESAVRLEGKDAADCYDKLKSIVQENSSRQERSEKFGEAFEECRNQLDMEKLDGESGFDLSPPD